MGVVFFAPTDARAQEEGEHAVSGTVTSQPNGKVMPGVNVRVKGTTIGTATNGRGQYSLTVPSSADTLVFSFVGYENREVGIQGRNTIDVSLTAEVEELSQVVVTGYGEETRAEVTGAVTQVTGDELARLPAANTSNMVAGVSGLITKQTSGLPGNDHRDISIRGFGDPLILVDGMEMSLDRVDPSNIESINVLKDASAAVYGARAGNGVILVKTKRGSQSEPQINFSSSVSAQTPTAFPDHVTAGQYAEMLREGALYMGVEPRFTEEEVQKYKNEAGGYESYDWYEATFDKYAMLSDYNMSVSGGSGTFQYFISGLHKNQNSALSSGDYNYKLWNVRANVDAYVNEDWTASLNLNFRREIRNRPGQSPRSIFVDLNRVQPIYDPTFPNEEYSSSGTNAFTANPLASSKKEKSGFTNRTNEWLEGNAEVEYSFDAVEGLSLGGVLGYRYGWEFQKDFSKVFDLYRYNEENDTYNQVTSGGQERIARNTEREWEIRPEVSLDYQRTFGGAHEVQALALVEFIESSEEDIFAARQGLFTTTLPYLFAGDLTQVTNDGSASEAGRKSYVGRVEYGYDDRYRIEGTFRADASHKFPEGSRWGYFPSVSGSWRISEESFMEGLDDTVNQLRLRLSYGQAGDDDVGAFEYLQGFNIRGTPIVLDGNEARRIVTETSLPNSEITWRTMTTYNAGIDVTLWDGLLSTSLDVYQRNSEDLFGTPQADYPFTFGAELPQLNINATRTRGFDLTMGHENQVGELSYSVEGNMSISTRKWTDYSEPTFETEAEKRVYKNEGKNLNRRVGYVALGLFDSQEEIDNWNVVQDGAGNSTLRPGDIKYKDLNGDGVITELDQKRIGYGSYPDMTYAMNLGASYKNFSLAAQFQGASRFTIQVSDIARAPYFNQSTPFKYQYENRWRPDDPTSDNPTAANPDARLPYVDATGSSWSENNNRTSTFWQKDGTYLRLKNLSLAYSLPETITGRLGVENVQFSASGSNLLTWDRLGMYSDAYDPESPGTQNARQYPLVRTYQFSVDVTL